MKMRTARVSFSQYRRSPDGVVELIRSVFGSGGVSGNQYVDAASGSRHVQTDSVVFSGRTKVEAKRALLRYWSRNRDDIDLTFEQLQRRCRLLEDGRTIVLKKTPQGAPDETDES